MVEKDFKGLFSRRVEKTIGEKELLEKLRSGKKLRIKHGVDPTTPDLHLGYTLSYHKLREFQDLGHTVVFLVGDFTARFGDPTDKGKARALKSGKDVAKLAKNYLKQALMILDPKKTEVRYNSEWYDKMSAEDLLKLMSHFTHAQMMERDMFQKRMKDKEEIGFHEPVYPMLQGYDSVMIKSDATVIGTDQIFNEMRGRDLQRDFGQAPQAILATPLLVGLDGKIKMSQSLRNYVGITEEPEIQYGKVMSVPDNLIYDYFELATDISSTELENIKRAMKKTNPRDLKMLLAHKVVSMFHDEAKADKAEASFVQIFQKRETPGQIPNHKLQKPTPLLDLLVSTKMVASKSEGRRLIEQKGIKIDGEPVTDPGLVLQPKTPATIQVGKRHFLKLG